MRLAGDLQGSQAMRQEMRQTVTSPNAGRNRVSRSLESVICASCDSDSSDLVFGGDRDGFVLCRECLSPLFYCEIGGQG
jgi:hypothetical protein